MQVDVSLNPGTTEPGRDVELRLQSKPNSYIGLLAVDQSVLLLRQGNDISAEDVEAELRSYSPDDSPSDALGIDGLAPRGLGGRRPGWRPGSATTQEVFDVSP